MANKSLVLTTYVFFARSGDTIDGVVVAREAKPDVSPESNWTDLGICRSYGVTNNSTFEVIQKGVPGNVVDYENLKTSDSRSYQLEMIEFNAIAIQALYNSGNITAVFQPGSAGSNLQGWIKVQQYNQLNQLITAVDTWADITLPDSEQPLGKMATYNLDVRQLYSTLNVGNLTNL